MIKELFSSYFTISICENKMDNKYIKLLIENVDLHL